MMDITRNGKSMNLCVIEICASGDALLKEHDKKRKARTLRLGWLLWRTIFASYLVYLSWRILSI